MNHSFQLFSLEHILTLCLLFFLSLFIFLIRNYFQSVRYFLGILLSASEVSEHIWKISAGKWSASSDLPLHLSDVAVLLAVIMLFTKSRALFQFLWYAGFASSLQAIASPDLGPYSFPHLIYLAFFASHGGVICACLLFAANQYRPKLASLWVTAGIVNLYGAAVFLLNQQLGSNYLFIMKKPEGGSLLDVIGPWPWYVLSMEGIMLISFFLLYLPFLRKRNGNQGR